MIIAFPVGGVENVMLYMRNNSKDLPISLTYERAIKNLTIMSINDKKLSSWMHFHHHCPSVWFIGDQVFMKYFYVYNLRKNRWNLTRSVARLSLDIYIYIEAFFLTLILPHFVLKPFTTLWTCETEGSSSQLFKVHTNVPFARYGTNSSPLSHESVN